MELCSPDDLLDGGPIRPNTPSTSTTASPTGRWERGMLVVTTTHLKKGFHRRNGVPVSTSARLTEYFIRHGNRLIHVQFTEDTAYLEEPFIRTTYFILNHELHGQIMNYVWDIAEEASGWGRTTCRTFHWGRVTRSSRISSVSRMKKSLWEGRRTPIRNPREAEGTDE